MKVDCARLKLIDNCCMLGIAERRGKITSMEEEEISATWDDASHNSSHQSSTTPSSSVLTIQYVWWKSCRKKSNCVAAFLGPSSWRASIMRRPSAMEIFFISFHFPWVVFFVCWRISNCNNLLHVGRPPKVVVSPWDWNLRSLFGCSTGPIIGENVSEITTETLRQAHKNFSLSHFCVFFCEFENHTRQREREIVRLSDILL